MSEFQIYGLILGALSFALVLFLIPRAVLQHLRLVQANKEGVPLEEGEEEGVSCRWVNVADVVTLVLVFALFACTWWGHKPAEGEVVVANGVIDKEVLLSSFSGQLIIVGIIFAIMFWRVTLPKQLGLSLKGRWKGLLWVPIILVVSWGFTGLVQAAGYFTYLETLYGESPLQEAVLLLQESDDVVLLGMMVVVACIGAPLSEEILFRGYLFPVVKRFSNSWFAIAFSGIFFGLIHFNLAGLPTLILMGCLLALAYERTKSLWIPVIAHLVFNSATTLVQLLSRYYPELSPM